MKQTTKDRSREGRPTKTFGGNSGGGDCHVPFLYGGVERHSCITDNNAGVPWCGTTYNYSKEFKWGNCVIDSKSPHASAGRGFRSLPPALPPFPYSLPYSSVLPPVLLPYSLPPVLPPVRPPVRLPAPGSLHVCGGVGLRGVHATSIARTLNEPDRVPPSTRRPP